MTSDQQPAPPESIPNYIADGLQRQAVPTLQAIISYCEELIEYLEEPPDASEIEGDDDVVDVEETENGGTLVKKMQKCGADCECNDGKGHGPYLWRVKRDGNGGQDWSYEGKA